MSDLEIEIAANIKQISADVKALNKNLDKTNTETEEAGKNAKSFGTHIKNAAKTFIVGSAFRLGLSAVKNDMEEVNQSALGVVRSLKEIGFLKGEAGKTTVKNIASDLNLSVAEVSAVAAPVFSANPNMSMAELETVIKNAFIEQKSSGAAAGDIAGGVSGLLNADDTFAKTGAVGAQNFLIRTAKQSNMSVQDIGKLAPLFATAAARGISPFVASAAFEMVTSLNISPERAVTMISVLMDQWAIYGEPEGMSFVEFVNYAVKIEDAKKRAQVLTSTGSKAAGIISSKGNAAFSKGVAGFKAAGEQGKSSSLIELNEKLASGELVGEQLDAALNNLPDNRQLSSDELERNAVIKGRGQQASEGGTAFLKAGLELSPFGLLVQGLFQTADPLSAGGNVEQIGRIEDTIQGRRNTIALENVAATNGELKGAINTNKVGENP